MTKALTAKAIEGVTAGVKRSEIPDGALPGLYLVVQPSGKKSWALRYRFEGKPRKLTIGPVLTKRTEEQADSTPALGQPMTLAEARKAARDALQALGEGRDPGAVKKVVRAAAATPADKDLVALLSTRFIDRYCKPKNRSWREVERQFNVEINPIWGNRKIQSIRKRDVMDLLDGIVDRGSPMTANRVYATLRRFFGWLEERDVIEASPMGSMKKPSPEKSRDRILTDDELQLFWEATGAFGYPFEPLWRLLALTGQRREEVAGMRWSELQLDGSEPLWTIPGERTKNGLVHTVPLAPAAVAIIKSLPRIGRAEYVFTTTGDTHVSGYSRSKGKLDKRMVELLEDGEELQHWTLHDLRRTMASGMARLGINLPIIERCLNHISGSFGGIVGVYQRHDFASEKRSAFEAWSNFVLQTVDEKTRNNVVRYAAR